LNAAEFTMISNAELDRLIAELGRHPLAEGELREVKEAVFVSLNQSQPEGIEYAFCLSSGGRMHLIFQEGRLTIPSNPLALSRDGLLASALYQRCLSILCGREADISTHWFSGKPLALSTASIIPA
jgi:hypothetical protein